MNSADNIIIYLINSLLLWLPVGAFCQDQNLVPNPSFSNVKAPMINRCQNGDHFTASVDDWYSATPASHTPDLITLSFLPNLEQRLLRGQGDSIFAGIVGGGQIGGEYIGVELNEYLHRDKHYSVSFRVAVPLVHNRKIWAGIFRNHFGLLFSQTKIISTGHTPLRHIPQISLLGRELKARKWNTIKFLFKPEEDSLKYLTVGIFQPEKNHEQKEFFYYFLDDFVVREADENALDEIHPDNEADNCTLSCPVFFANGQWSLSSDAASMLDSIILNWTSCEYKNIIHVTGYADHTGDEKSNLLLSQKRAEQVFNYLSSRGIETEHFRVNWKGSIVINDVLISPAGEPKNRRVDILFSPVELLGDNAEEEKEDDEDFQSVYLFSKELDAMPNGLQKEAGYTFIGNYEPYLKRAKDDNVYFKEDIELIPTARPVSAQGFILSKAKNERIILFNESHNNPKHRAFVISLLEKLYAEGYRHLGLEMLFNDGEAVNKRGYPVLSDGFFVREPIAGELIRIALEIGFRVFGYDPPQEETDRNIAEMLKKDSSLIQLSEIELGMLSRDYLQALHIATEIKKYPNDKFIVFAGHGHISENEIGAWIPMALNLKQHFHIDPLTVDQITGDSDISQSPYSNYVSSTTLTSPVVLLTNDNQPLVLKKHDFYSDSYKSQFDMQVVHPLAAFRACNCPDWATLNGKRKMLIVQPPHPLDTPDATCLIFAFFESESMGEAIPADVTEWKNAAQPPCLLLRSGSYNLFYKYSDGKLATSKAKVK